MSNWNKTGCLVTNDPQHGRIFLPVDDDDWFHPDVGADVMTAFQDPKVSLVYWQNWRFDLRYTHTFKVHSWSWAATNGYALRAGSSHERLYVHSRVSLTNNKICSVFIDKPLSITVCHPASWWHLQHIDNLDRSNFRFVRQPCPPELNWAQSEIDSTFDFMSKMRSSP